MAGNFLTPQQKQAIETMPTASSRLRRRAQVVLLYNAGKTTREVSAEAGLSLGRARYWRRQFALHGMNIFAGVIQPSPVNPSLPSSIPYPQRLDAPGIQPDDTLADAGRKTWLFHFAEMLYHEPGTRLGNDIEALHDMRVATRRIRAAFEVFAQAFEPDALRPYLKGLRATGRALGRARDMDVLVDKTTRGMETLPPEQRAGLEPLLEAWKQEQAAAHRELLAFLEGKKYQRFKETFNQCLQSPSSGTLPTGPQAAQRVRDAVPLLIYTRLATVRSYEAILPTATITQLHALRIEFKKLRYAVEFFKEVLGKTAKDVIDLLKSLQDHLGELHDADVACDLIRQFLDQWETQQTTLPLLERSNPEAILLYLACKYTERYRLMTTFPARWEQFKRPEFQQNLAMAIAEV